MLAPLSFSRAILVGVQLDGRRPCALWRRWYHADNAANSFERPQRSLPRPLFPSPPGVYPCQCWAQSTNQAQYMHAACHLAKCTNPRCHLHGTRNPSPPPSCISATRTVPMRHPLHPVALSCLVPQRSRLWWEACKCWMSELAESIACASRVCWRASCTNQLSSGGLHA